MLRDIVADCVNRIFKEAIARVRIDQRVVPITMCLLPEVVFGDVPKILLATESTGP